MSEIVSRHIKVTEDTTLAKLGVFDQIKLLIARFSNNDVAELDAAEKLSGAAARMKASLLKLIKTAAKGMQDGSMQSATLQVSSKYLPYIDDVIDPVRGEGRYYDFEVYKKDLPADVEYKFLLVIKKKVTI